MQQYRVNYPLLIGLIVGTLVCSGAVYALWKFQIDRKSGWLIAEAEKAHKAGDLGEARRYYAQYLTIRNDDEVRFTYARTCLEAAEQEDAELEDLQTAWQVLESTLRDKHLAAMPEAKELRKRLIKLYGSERMRRYQDALDHLAIMLQEDQQDSELQVLRTSYLFRSGNLDEAMNSAYKLIGYDPVSGKFDVSKAIAPHEVDIYGNLAMALQTKARKPDLAEDVINQLVEVNGESAAAYLMRGQFLELTGDADGARLDIEKAYELAPENADVLLAMATRASRDKDYEKAAEYVATGKKLYPEDARFYQIAFDVLVRQEQFEQALAEIDEGLKTIKGAGKYVLMIMKADLNFMRGDLKRLREAIEEMAKAGIRPEFIEWYEACLLAGENKWRPARDALNRLRPKVATGFGNLSQQVDSLLGLCYERLGQPDMAANQYRVVLENDPQDERARAGLERVRALRGLEPEGEQSNPLQQLIAEELKKPESERNWSAVDAMLPKIADEQKWDEATVKLFQARLMMMRGDYEGASNALREADKASPKNLQIHRTAIQLARLNPKAGPEKAMELWNRVVKEFGDSPALRIDKAEILIALHRNEENKDELRSELALLATGIDDWSVEQQVGLWRGLAGIYLNLGMPEESRQYLSLAAEKLPHDLPLRLALFALALEANDDAGMKEAQDKILQIVGDKNDSDWLYTEARRKLSLVRRGQLGPEALPEIREMVDRALQQRKEWHELHVLNAELELMNNNVSLALQHFDRAASLGRPSTPSIVSHIRLLASFGRFNDAAKQLERIPEALRQPLLGQLYPEILFRTNKVEDAIREAREAAEAEPTRADRRYWYSQLLARAAQAPDVSEERRKQGLAQAIEQMRKAVELEPEFPEAWLSLISYHGALRDIEQANAVLRDAQLALSGENLQMFLARSYEALGRWFDAETMYRALYEAAPDDLARVQQLAAFYMSDLYQRPDKLQKVSPLLNKIMRAGAENKVPPNDPNLLWARRMAAKILAATGDYQNLLKAENLLASNAQDGVLSLESKLEMAEILAPRPDPISRFKAISLLEEVSKAQPLSERGEIMLGQLYYAVGEDWRKYSRQMEKAIARFPNSVLARASYVENLLKRNDQRSIDLAINHVNRIRQLVPDSPITFDLTVRLAKKVNRQPQVIAEIVRRLPKLDDPKAITEEQALSLAQFAKYLTDLGDLDTSERIYRALAARDPSNTPALAAFLGMHRDPEQCFTMLSELYQPARSLAVLQVAMPVVRQRRDQVGEKFDADIQRWLDGGLRENPDSIDLLMVQADLFDLQKRYEDASNVYRKLLERKDLVGLRRAVVLNNLSYLVALAGSATAGDVDPLKLVEEAKEIMGPNSEILDTRAVVYISRKQYKEAISDLTLAVTDNPTASKYFHKAQAHLLAGDNRGAIEAWEKAEELGLNRDALNRMEFDHYEKMKTQIDQLRNASVTQAEPTRRAG